MEISPKQVADLRAETGVGMMDCKRALVEAGGDFEEAKKILRKKGLAAAARKADRVASEGLVVARVTPSYALKINASEVADAFEVPLAFVMDEANHARKSRDWKGVTRHYYEMPFGERYIWGVTAGILRNLYEKIYG